MHLIVVVSDPRFRDVICDSLVGHAHLSVCASRRRVLALLRRRVPVAAILTEVADHRGDSSAPFISAVRQRNQTVPLVGIVRPREQDRRALIGCVRAGLSEIVRFGVDDVQSVVQNMISPPPVERSVAAVLGAVSQVVPVAGWPILEHCICLAPSGLTARQLSLALGIPRTTLSRRLAVAGLPPPATVLVWSRLLVAASLLENDSQTVAGTAILLGFRSAAAFRRVLRRRTGLCPSDLRRVGGLRDMLARSPASFARHGSLALNDEHRDEPLACDSGGDGAAEGDAAVKGEEGRRRPVPAPGRRGAVDVYAHGAVVCR